jgi:hypothetical protein
LSDCEDGGGSTGEQRINLALGADIAFGKVAAPLGRMGAGKGLGA